MTGPIKPSEIASARKETIPEGVFEAFNELIVEKLDGRTAIVLQSDVVQRIVEKLKCSLDNVFDKGWMNVEDSYREAGWEVEHDKPGYNETYKAFFTFTRP